MIASLEGLIIEKNGPRLTLEVNGVGYEISMTPQATQAARVGEQRKIYTVHVVREDSQELFGFLEPETRSLFKTLINISGVGPRTALQVLSLGSSSEVMAAIDAGDVTRLSSAPGVGAKTAQKIILELRGKLVQPDGMAADTDVLEALVGLGYTRNDVTKTLRDLPASTIGTEDRLRAALKMLGKR
jgi:Holliday junction DNA helicase RuvA